MFVINIIKNNKIIMIMGDRIYIGIKINGIKLVWILKKVLLFELIIKSLDTSKISF